MPMTPHHERHFMASETVRDIVIGMSDGLTVPFALAAGLAGAVSGTQVVVTAGLAEIAAGAIAMGLGGYLAARTDIDHYASEYRREWRETQDMPDEERREVAEILVDQGLGPDQADLVVAALAQHPEKWVRFMMRFELGLEEPDPARAPKSALTIGASYIAGGLIPLLPYFFFPTARDGLVISVATTLAALGLFGAIKGRMTGVPPVKAGLQTMAIGGIAAATAYGIAAAVGG